MDYQYFLHAFLKCLQNNLEYLIQNTIHQAIQIYHSMLKLLFKLDGDVSSPVRY